MQIISDISKLRAALKPARQAGQRIALVPTMGALHAGHLKLVEIAKQHADLVVVSIFVNPTQFGPTEDYSRYPRDIAKDSAQLQTVGADLVFTPSAADIYPPAAATSITVSSITADFEGRLRPTHFAGVALIVAKLFNIVQPDIAVFGEKDFQQLAVIRCLVVDLNFPIEIIAAPIVREPSGLALSSRNAYLSTTAQAVAPQLQQVLQGTAQALRNGGDTATILKTGHDKLLAAGFTAVDYLALVDAATLTPLKTVTAAARLLAVARLDGVRLLDNLAVSA